MKKITLVMLFLLVFICTGYQFASAKIKKHVNPVHARRQAAYEKNKEVYKGERIIDNSETNKTPESQSDDKSDKKSDKKKPADKGGKGTKDHLVELMKEFDKDGDGVISYEEMEAAKAAGKDQELRASLDEEKNQNQKKKSKSKVNKSLQNSAGQ